MFLLDTNVISEMRKDKPHGGVLAWLDHVPESSLRLPAVAIGEIQKGIELTRKTDPAKAAEFQSWLDKVVRTFPILPADAAIFQQWAKLRHGKPNHHLEDALIAATALVHGLTVVTRNSKDFKAFGVNLLNPFLFGR
jgi:predicted nucleic acid-binding protein